MSWEYYLAIEYLRLMCEAQDPIPSTKTKMYKRYIMRIERKEQLTKNVLLGRERAWKILTESGNIQATFEVNKVLPGDTLGWDSWEVSHLWLEQRWRPEIKGMYQGFIIEESVLLWCKGKL